MGMAGARASVGRAKWRRVGLARTSAPQGAAASCPAPRPRRATPGWRLAQARERTTQQRLGRVWSGAVRSAMCRCRCDAPRSTQSCTSASCARASALCSAARSTSGPYRIRLLLAARPVNRCAGAAPGGGARAAGAHEGAAAAMRLVGYAAAGRLCFSAAFSAALHTARELALSEYNCRYCTTCTAACATSRPQPS
jgi:hypothetical protein